MFRDVTVLRGMPLALVLAIAACTVTPVEPGDHGVRAKASATPAAGGSPHASPAATPHAAGSAESPTLSEPEEVPSLSLLLSGLVTVDAHAMLVDGLAEPLAGGVRLIGQNGAGLISDKGYGVIGQNGAALVAKTKYRTAALAAFGLLDDPEAPDHAQRPVAGILVKAVSLADGTVLAGPVATDAEGHYHLGFLTVPASNLRIVAQVSHSTDPRFAYSTLIAPAPEPVITSDTSQLLAEYLVQVLAARLQTAIDARKAGQELVLAPGDFDADSTTAAFIEKINKELANVDPDTAAALDNDGQFAREFSEHVLAYVDLTDPAFKDMFAAMDEIRLFGVGLSPAPEPPLSEQAVKLASVRQTVKTIPDLLQRYGMPAERATALYERMDVATRAIGAGLAATATTRFGDSLRPSTDASN